MEAFYLEIQGGCNLFGTPGGGPNCEQSNPVFFNLLRLTAPFKTLKKFGVTPTCQRMTI